MLATNIAETSITVPGIRYVVDSGLGRVKRYSYRNKVEQLQVEPISQAAAQQRAAAAAASPTVFVFVCMTNRILTSAQIHRS